MIEDQKGLSMTEIHLIAVLTIALFALPFVVLWLLFKISDGLWAIAGRLSSDQFWAVIFGIAIGVLFSPIAGFIIAALVLAVSIATPPSSDRLAAADR
jgi:hypothetical protein